MSKSDIIKSVEAYINEYFKEKISTEYFYHSSTHVQEVVNNAKEIAESYQLEPEEVGDLVLAAWFHDIGIEEGYEDHEDRSADHAVKYLGEQGVATERLDQIKKLILATKPDYEPNSIAEKIMRDADTSHVGKKDYFEKLALLKTEWEQMNKSKYDEREWLQLNLDFLKKHKFYTPLAQSTFNKRKRKNIIKLQDRLTSLVEFENEYMEVPGFTPTRMKKKSDRGIETMFRVTLRNHNHLSRIADNKANIMLSINAIMLSIVISSLTPKLDSNPTLTIPTIIIIVVCMVSIVLATLATKPKITAANYSDEKFLNKKFNILFFGNFYRLPIDKFEWGIDQLMQDGELLYSSLAKDLYYLGLVLAKKYRYLRACYNFFVFGLLLAAVSYILALTTTGENPLINF